jgi:hypothetical protein
MRVTDEMIVADVQRMRKETGNLPTQQSYRDSGRFSITTIRWHFGSWNQLLTKVFGSVNIRQGIPRIEVRCGNPACSKTIQVREDLAESRYCSVACSNVAKHRRKRKVYACKACGEDASYRRAFCQKCEDARSIENRTLDSFKSARSDANRYNQIRQHARKVGSVLPEICETCGYKKHAPVCHRKAISLFPGSTLVKEINALSNLARLCPTHHWEFDHGLLTL